MENDYEIDMSLVPLDNIFKKKLGRKYLPFLDEDNTDYDEEDEMIELEEM